MQVCIPKSESKDPEEVSDIVCQQMKKLKMIENVLES